MVNGAGVSLEVRRRVAHEPLVTWLSSRRGPRSEDGLQGFSRLCIRVSAPLVEYFQRASSWHRLKKSVARFLRYRGNLQRSSKGGKSREPTHPIPILSLPAITVSELEITEIEILRNVQQFHFPEELDQFSQEKQQP